MIPDVSVIVPTYNRASLIGNTIRGLLDAQVPGLEIVIVDDGSKDDYESVLRSFGESVVYVRQVNAGPARARNYGFTKSRGRYVLFLDDDDGWHPGTVAQLAAVLDAHPDLPCVFGDTSMGSPEDGYVSFVDTYGGPGFHALGGKRLDSRVKVLDRWPFFRALARRNVMFLGSLLLRRATFERVGGFDEALRGAADWEFFMRLAASADVGFRAGDPVAIYLKHATGMSTDSTHMETDFGKALSNVLSKCELPSEIRAYVKTRLRDQLFGFAYVAYDRGDLGSARAQLGAMLRDGHYGLREVAYWGLSSMPAASVRLLRGLRQRLGPAVAVTEAQANSRTNT
jgi:glycosyltransferase involved in cell wall biosynthesis